MNDRISSLHQISGELNASPQKPTSRHFNHIFA
jgi:hypothetical protein